MTRIPELIVCSTGRSGTRSMWSFLSNLYEANGRPDAKVVHERHATQIIEALPDFYQSGNDSELRRIFEDFDVDVDVGLSTTGCLPLVHELFGPEVKIIHLIREREATIRSMQRHAETHPDLHVGYGGRKTHYGGPRIPNAVDQKLMSEREWEALPLRSRYLWLYKRTHAAIRRYRRLFNASYEFHLEDLADESKLRSLVTFVNPDWARDGVIPEPTHSNQKGFFNLSSLSLDQRRYFDQRFAEFDWQRFFSEMSYPSDYFLLQWGMILEQDSTNQEMQRSMLEYYVHIRDVLTRLYGDSWRKAVEG